MRQTTTNTKCMLTLSQASSRSGILRTQTLGILILGAFKTKFKLRFLFVRPRLSHHFPPVQRLPEFREPSTASHSPPAPPVGALLCAMHLNTTAVAHHQPDAKPATTGCVDSSYSLPFCCHQHCQHHYQCATVSRAQQLPQKLPFCCRQ